MIIFSCSKHRVKFKPQPTGDGWEICTLCKGSGIAGVYDTGSSFKGDGTDEDFSCCFLPSGSAGKSSDEKRQKYSATGEPCQYPIEKREYKKLQEESVPAERSMVKHKVKCPGCSGVGWMEKSEKRAPWDYDKKIYEELNSEINKKSLK